MCNQPTRLTQPCIPPGSLNRVPASAGWGKGWNVTSAGWQVTLCDPIWHVSSSGGEACCELLYPITLLYFLLLLSTSTTTATVATTAATMTMTAVTTAATATAATTTSNSCLTGFLFWRYSKLAF